LETIPGIGIIGATAITATITDPTLFKSGREFAAWIGLVPTQNSTGGRSDWARSPVSPLRDLS
jgi:transposase